MHWTKSFFDVIPFDSVGPTCNSQPIEIKDIGSKHQPIALYETSIISRMESGAECHTNSKGVETRWVEDCPQHNDEFLVRRTIIENKQLSRAIASEVENQLLLLPTPTRAMKDKTSTKNN